MDCTCRTTDLAVRFETSSLTYLRYSGQENLEFERLPEFNFGPGLWGAERNRNVDHIPIIAVYGLVPDTAFQVQWIERQRGPVQFDDVLRRILVVHLYRQINEVVDAQAQLAEPVHAVRPPEPRLVPRVAPEHRPAAYRRDHVQQRSRAPSVQRTFVHAHAVQPLGQHRVSRAIGAPRIEPPRVLQQTAHFVDEHVVHRAVCGPRRFVVVHLSIPGEPAARELVEIVARPYRLVHVGQHGRRGLHAAIGHANVFVVIIVVRSISFRTAVLVGLHRSRDHQ